MRPEVGDDTGNAKQGMPSRGCQAGDAKQEMPSPMLIKRFML